MAEQTVSTEGLIIKALGGFYYLRTPLGDIECRARGLFRKEEITPMVGDQAIVDLTEEGKGYVVEILPRKNSLIRPPVANLDRLVIVVSATQPVPNPLIIDKLTAIAERRGIPVAVVFSKIDLKDVSEITSIYRKAGYPIFTVDSMTGQGVEEIRELVSTGLTAFCGNSGAGKSSLLNALFPDLTLATAEISRKLGRGRHTTRHVELFDTGSGGYIADTPGFTAIEFMQFEKMMANELENCFPEFEAYLGQCRYTGCSHTAERDCAIREAVAKDEISESRYKSYCALYQELKSVKEWQL